MPKRPPGRPRKDRERAAARDSGGLRAGDDGDSGHSQRREPDSLSSLGSLDGARLPNVPDGHWQTPDEAFAETPSIRIRDGDDVLPRLLNEGVVLSFEEAVNILRWRHESIEDKTVLGIIVRAKCSIINTMQTTAMRVNEERFRQQRFDRLPELIKLIQEEEKRLPAQLLDAC
jgi:hypothetical protein